MDCSKSSPACILHPDVLALVASLIELVEEQERLIRTMLIANKKLLKK